MVWRLSAAVLLTSSVLACLAAGVSATEELPRCDGRAYRYELGLNGAGGALILDAYVKYLGGRDCRVSDRVVLRFTDAHGHLLRVRNDPIRGQITAVIETGSVDARRSRGLLVEWWNWCTRVPKAFAFSVRSRVKFAVFRWHEPPLPECIDPSKPSVLRG